MTPSLDIVFLAWNRLEFTRASLAALQQNTDWSLVSRLWLYDDGSEDGARKLMRDFAIDFGHRVMLYTEVYLIETQYRSPVAIMNDYLTHRDPATWFAKIDSDTVVPPGWLPECLRMLDRHPDVGLLGIEAVHPPSRVDAWTPERSIVPTGHIGGIGLMRTAAFAGGLPHAHGRLGFSDWQVKHPEVMKAWLNPALPVILLDRLPFEPWSTLSAQYEAAGWQRPWKHYTAADAKLWEWWRK